MKPHILLAVLLPLALTQSLSILVASTTSSISASPPQNPTNHPTSLPITPLSSSEDTPTLLCETSPSSPLREDVRRASRYLSSLATECGQYNFLGSGCTLQASNGTASISLCGGWGTIDCKALGKSVEKFSYWCMKRFEEGEGKEGKWRTGGVVQLGVWNITIH